MKRVEFSSRWVLFFLLYILWVWLEDAVLFFGSCLGMEISGRAAAVLGAVLTLPAVWWLYRHAACRKLEERSRWDLAAAAVFTAFFFVRALFPDQSFDIANYHILLQEPVWRDMIHEDVLPGAWQGFTFPLSDRLFWLFRKVLGYRMGTVLNLLGTLLIYRQLRGCLEQLCGKRGRRLQPLAAFLITAQSELLLQLSSYMVEIPAVVLVLESVFFLLKERPEREETVTFALLQGFLFALKMTQVIFVLPLLALYLAKNRKTITFPLFLGCFLAGAAPASIYLLHNALTTGNPIFPYYNTLFQSPYCADATYKDVRWGPAGWQQVLLWPIYAVIRPDWRQSEIPNPYTVSLGISWCAGIACILRQLAGRKKPRKEYALPGLLVLLSSLLWSAVSGHSRYYMAGFMLLMLWGFVSAVWLAEGRGKSWMVAAAFCLLAVPGPVLAGKNCLDGLEWSWRPSVFRYPELYRRQLAAVGRDRNFGTDAQKTHSRRLLLLESQSHFTTLLNPDCPVISWMAVTEAFADPYYEEWAERLTRELDEGLVMDTIVAAPKGQLPDLTLLFEYRLAACRIELVDQDIFRDQDIYLVQLANPAGEFKDMTKRRPAVVLDAGAAPADIGQGENGTDVRVEIGLPGLPETAAGPAGSGENGVVEIYGVRDEAEERLLVNWEKEAEPLLLARIPVRLSEKGDLEATISLPEGPGVTWLGASLKLVPEQPALAPLAGVWIRTSLTGEQTLDGARYFIDEDGCVRRGLHEKDGRQFVTGYFGTLESGWRQQGDLRYYVDMSGHLYTGWLSFGEGWYYLSEDGIMQTGWIHLDGDYYLDEDGVMADGPRQIDGVDYKFGRDGRLRE